jgi:hypothetical protein
MKLNAGIDGLIAAVKENDAMDDLPRIADKYGVDLEALTYVCMRRAEMLTGLNLMALAGASATWLDGFFAALALAERYYLTQDDT